MPNYLAIETDTHGGHRQGLCNPDAEITMEDEQGNQYQMAPDLTATQKYLWQLREENIAALVDIAKGGRIDYLHAGDQTQGNKYVTQLVSTAIIAQIEIALANAQPILSLENLITARFVHGTASHEFMEGTTGGLLQKMYALAYPEKNIKHTWHSLLDFDGLTVDLAHHGPFPGSRKWLEGNVARYYLRDKMYDDMLAGKKPPKIFIRGHYHTKVWETLRVQSNGGWCESTLLVIPSMCGMGVYARQATRSSHKISNGMVIIEHDQGRIIDVHWMTKTLDIRTKEVL